MRVVKRVGLPSSEGWTEAGISGSKMVPHVAGRLVWAVGRRPVSLTTWTFLYRAPCVSSKHGSWLLPEQKLREHGGSYNAFHELASKVTPLHFVIPYWLPRSSLFTVGRDYTNA